MNAPYRVPERVTTGASLTAYWPFIDGPRAVSILRWCSTMSVFRTLQAVMSVSTFSLSSPAS